MIISFSLRRSGPPAIAGTQCGRGFPGPWQACSPAAATSTLQSRRCASSDPFWEARVRLGRRQTLGHRDPNFGFTAGGVGGTWI